MDRESCSHCNGQLVTVNGALICTNCGLVNKTALENKEDYLSPAFFHERKLRQERDNTKNQNFVNRIKNEIAYLANYLNLPPAVEHYAYLKITDIIKLERVKNPEFPFHTKEQDLTFNCLIAIGIVVASLKFLEASLITDIITYFENKGEAISLNDIKNFNSKLTIKNNEIDEI